VISRRRALELEAVLLERHPAPNAAAFPLFVAVRNFAPFGISRRSASGAVLARLFAADLGGTLYAFDAATGAVLWRLTTGQSMGGEIVSYLAGRKQRIGVAAGMKSPIWPGGSSASQIVVYGLQ